MLNLKNIIETINHVSGIDITQRTRQRNVVILRGLYYKIARENTGESLAAIGKLVCKNHATVLHSLKFVDQDLTDIKYNNIYESALALLNAETDEIIVEGNKEIHIKYITKHIEVENKELPTYILTHLKEYSDVELLELYETRLKPFKSVLNSRVLQKEIVITKGALILR